MASIRKRTWVSGGAEKTAWVVDYKDQEGKRVLKTFATKREAEAFRTEMGYEVSQGTHTRASASIMVAQAGKEWVKQGELDGLERSTLREYQNHLDRHIKPFLGGKKLSDLSVPMVNHFRNQLLEQGRSQAMAKKIVGSLGALIATAQDNGKVSRNVVREMTGRRKRGNKRHKRRVEIPTKDEIRDMLNKADGRWRPLMVTAIFTGLRASELRGLSWQHVDFDNKVIRVRQRADRWNEIGPPKSEAGNRDVPMAPMVVNTLKDWQLRQNEDWLKLQKKERRLDKKSPPKLVFANGYGNVENLGNIYRRGFGPLQVECGITDGFTLKRGKKGKLEEVPKPKYGIHALRHAAASLFIEQGLTPKRVQAIMGHSSIQMTFDTYGHLFPSPDDDQAAMEQIQARLLPA